MGKYDRGVYEPSDEVRAFDGAEDEDDVEGSRLPLLIVLALLVLAMFAGVVWLAYTQGVARGRGDTPVLTAASGPERVAPPAAASGTVPYQGFKIYEQQAPADDAAEASAPKSAPVAMAPAAPKPAPVAAPAPPKVAAMTPPPPAKPAPAPAKLAPAAAPPKSVAGLIQQSSSVPATKPAPAKPAAAPPAAKPVAAPSSVATGAPRQLGMAAVPPPAAPKVAAAPPPVAAAKPAGGGFVLQIGAYKSQADAEAAWKTYKGRHAALLSGYSENIQQADLGDRGTWYRLRIGGLSDREVAGALCERLKADGGACLLGR